jgi:hypothetical protein
MTRRGLWLDWLGPALALAVVWWVSTTVGPTSDVSVSDLYLYGVYADLVQHGSVPFRDFGFEYPPLAIVPIVLARWLGGAGAHGYSVAFNALTLLAGLGLQACAGLIAGRRAAWLMVLLPVACGALVRTHLDVFPAALSLAGLALLLRHRPVWGLAILGVGAAMKLVPGLIAVVAILWLVGRGERRAALRGAVAFAGVCVVVLLPFAGQGLVDMVRFHLDRPVQIESGPASVLWALGGTYVTGTNIHPDAFKSNGLAGPHVAAVTTLFTVLLVAVLAWIAVLAARRPHPRELVLCSFAAVLAFVVLGKVLSPQYIVWLFPFAVIAWCWKDADVARSPLSDGLPRLAAVCILAAAVLGQLWFPGRYFELVASDQSVVLLVAIRNVLFVVALAALLAALALARPARPAPA